ncbi:hypothetical protein ACFO3J_32130 [Streptomyces polygonati]|uniref:Cytochrome C oxidase subunit I n=1 Tax=Streptomyces polygonati TaxID=1617087 RepID=A0ABV8HVI1_9ACTN
MPPGQDAVRGMAQLEGYLMWSAEIEEADRRAALFADRLPWLTTGQRADVERLYSAERLAVTQHALARIAERTYDLQGEYAERYRQLRARCVAGTLAGVGCASAVCALLGVFNR